MRQWRGMLPVLLLLAGAGPALAAEKEVSCTVTRVTQTAFSVLVTCAEAVDDSGPFGTETITWYAPDLLGRLNQFKQKPVLSPSETLRAFQAVALQALQTKKPLLVTFTPGARPGAQFDCWNSNCRLSRSWALLP